MSKPVNLYLKDWLVGIISKDLEMDEELCNKVVSWAYLQAKEATKTEKIIELSGFGKIQFSKAKYNRRMAKLISLRDSSIKAGNIKHSENYEKSIQRLKNKFFKDELEGNTGGVEERPVPAEETKGISETNSGGETGNM
jgi:nucleoid DNA-binding protein